MGHFESGVGCHSFCDCVVFTSFTLNDSVVIAENAKGLFDAFDVFAGAGVDFDFIAVFNKEWHIDF